MNDPNVAKRAAAVAAANLVTSGMTIGLGSGSTFLFALERLGERIRAEGLAVRGVPTSSGTEAAARKFGVPVVSLDDVDVLDLAIDGADEIDRSKHMIKGGGAALLREKIVAAAAREMIVIVDEAKIVNVLGERFLLPVEVLPFGWKQTARKVAATGCTTEPRRTKDGAMLVTDNGNHILDCRYAGIVDPAGLHTALAEIPGVVESGLFIAMAGRVFVGNASGGVRMIP